MKFPQIRSGGIRLFLLIVFVSLEVLSTQAQNPPMSIGYTGSQVVQANDTLQVFFSGGALNSQHGALNPSGQVVVGMPLIRFAPRAFEKDMFVSKGYYPDYVLLTWELARFLDQVTFFRIYRKLLSEPNTAYTQVATVSKDVTSWQDEFAEAGVMYAYKIKAEGLYAFEENFVNTLEGVGFRLPSGSVSGRVTFVDEGGAPVEGVTIIAETDDVFGSTSAYLDGSSSSLGVSHPLDHADWKFETQFAFQAWVKPDATGTTPATLFQKGTQYEVTYSPGTISFTAGASSVSLAFTEKPNEFFHVSAVRTAEDSLKLFVIYEEDEIFKSSVFAGGLSTPANNDQVYMGRNAAGSQFFKGNLDEIRIWKTVPSDASIQRESLRLISGTEEGLTAYYRVNEGTGDFFYDLSREGFTFHEYHGSLTNVTWSSDVPTASQLAVKGYTDSNGNYLITGIPYTSSGSLYTFTPAFGTHKFSPTQASRFLGPGSNTFSGVNFVDKSSFSVTGYVFYSNTRFPVSGVQIEVDGVAALSSGGSPVVTDGNGFFSLDVPIGEHRLQLIKQGHVFEGEGYFPSKTGLFDFQADLNIDPSFFKDSTLVRVIGKVVGGPVEGAKPSGLGQSVNNIGDATVVLEAQKPYDLKEFSGDSTGTWQNFYFNEGDSVKYATTGYEILDVTPRKLSISPDPTTGEFMAYLLPERYNITDISAGSYTKSDFGDLVGTTLDLTNVFITKTELDSALVDAADQNSGYAYDSLPYNAKRDLVLRLSPSVAVTSKDPNIARFWDDKVTLDDGSEVTIVSGDDYNDWLTSAPIFTQRKKYEVLVSVFEEYTHPTNGVDRVPVVDGEVQIQNALAIKTARQVFELDSKGQVLYEFLGGVPNTATGGVGDYQKTMSITVFSGKGGAISTEWSPPGGGTFSGYVFGGRPVGNNFVTTGPNVVSMILRDPYGSSSYAYYETGTSTSTEVSFEVSNAETATDEVKFQMGSKITTNTGIPGATVENEIEIEADLNIGVEQSLAWTGNETMLHTVTNTQRWSTSDSPDFVGSNGDVFIGNSTNIVYGNSVFVELVPSATCTDCTGPDIGGYKVGLKNALRLNPEFGTAFQYTQNHIENFLIPDLEFLRNEFLKNNLVSVGGNYTSNYLPTDEAFGSDNTTFTRTATGITGGDSYNYTIPASFTGDVYVDTVEFYNNQIQGWKDLLARNEKEKLESKLITNYSYDAGVIFESSSAVEDTKTRTETFEFTIASSVATSAGITVNGSGVSMSLSMNSTTRETKNTTTGSTTSQIFGYVLSDSDEGDYYSIDVRDPGSRTGPVFKVRGGQSMCPYIGEEKTKYYTPGAVLSEATVQREVPQLEVENAIVSDVLEGKPANFVLNMSNISDSGDPAWYRLSIDEASVVGALVEIDGAPLEDGRSFFIPAGTTLSKVLSISQVDRNITEFEDVGLILHSLCQFDPTDPWPELADSVTVSAYFQPACSDVLINSPDDSWLVNTSQIVYNGNDISSIPISIDLAGYDLNHSSFETIAVQYKASSSSQWLTDMVYYVDQTQFNAASEPKTYINGLASLNYILEMKDLPDRNYDIRLKTTCSDGTENFSEIRSGIKDVKRPVQFGAPQPGDGILSPGEDILLTLDEEIDAGILTQFNFSVKGVLNGQPIDHNSVLFFDGIDDNATTVEGVNLTNKSFTVEFWTKKLTDNVQGVIFSQGDIEIGFDASNKLYTKLDNETFVSDDPFTSANNWMHWAVVYDYPNKEVAFYMNDQIALNKTSVTGDLEASGRIYFGQSLVGANHYHGYLHDFRIWESARGQGAIVANMSTTLRGDEVGLSSLWPMNEANGASAVDLSRNKNALLNGADWRVFPVGYVRTFVGTNAIALPSGTIPVSADQDMTLEFWFKGAPQSNTVLFSNGRGNGDDSTPPFENIWVVGSDAGGKLYVQNNGTKMTVQKDVFDNNWHHLSIVLRRIANTTVMVDGNQEAFTSSANMGGLTGAQLSLGARQFRTGGSYTYDQHFTGSIDEFRLWKLARTRDQLELDRNSALNGDEIGLLAYLPFDDFDINQVLQPSLESTTDEGTIMATAEGVGGTADNTDVPMIKEARPVQNVGFNWVVNDDQIIINITEDPAVVEKTVLEITVRDIEDLNQNRLASPITWTAFVNKNTVLWDEQVVNLEKQLYDELIFTVDILNLGGTEQTYEISNIPSWLIIDQPTGNLLPNSSKTLKFTIKESTNIGEYEQSLYLSSDFGFQEKFDLNLRVFEQAPAWVVDPGNFQYGMSVIGVLDINGTFSTDENDMIAALIGDEIRGVANLEYVAAYDRYMFFMDAYSNNSGGESMTFKVWNADEGRVYVNVIPQLNFVNNSVVGSPSSPQVFEAKDEVIVTYHFKQGWNWISFNVKADDMQSSSQLFDGLTLSEGDIIKTIDKFDQYAANIGWVGELSNQGGFDVYTGYKLRLSQAQTFNMSGKRIKVDTVGIPLQAGWNWVSYPSTINMEIGTALAGVNFTNGDFIKGQEGFALYDNLLGWIGSLNFLVPTSGYMLKTTNAATLYYPDPQSVRTGQSYAEKEMNVPAGWDFEVADYANSMSIVASIDACGAAVHEGDLLGVFVGEESRGFASLTTHEQLETGLFFLNVYGQGDEERVTFKYYSSTHDKVYDLSYTEVFTSDIIKGSINQPIQMAISDAEVCDNILAAELERAGLKIYPNPFDTELIIELSRKSDVPLELTLTDVTGRVLTNATMTAQKLTWSGNNVNGLQLMDGIYFIKVKTASEQFQFRVIKKNR